MLHSTYHRFFVTTLLLLSFFVLAFAGDKDKTDWPEFSTQLLEAVKSQNTGIHASAMQQMIQYYDSLDIDAARYDIMDLFLKSDNQGVRQLALVALHKINNNFDMGYLQLHYPYEKDEVIKNQLASVLQDTGRQIPRQ